MAWSIGSGGESKCVLQDGRNQCVLCGEVLDVPTDEQPLVLIKARVVHRT
jgi:hypothetical protein